MLSLEHGVGDVGSAHGEGPPFGTAMGHQLYGVAGKLFQQSGCVTVQGVMAGGVVEAVIAPLHLQATFQDKTTDIGDLTTQDIRGSELFQRFVAGTATHHAGIKIDIADHLTDLAEDDRIP